MADQRPPGPWEEDRVKADLALSLVAAAIGTARPDHLHGRMSGGASRARRLAIYVTHVVMDVPLERVSLAFGITRTTASIACRWAEDLREAEPVDQFIERVEVALSALFGPKPPKGWA